MKKGRISLDEYMLVTTRLENKIKEMQERAEKMEAALEAISAGRDAYPLYVLSLIKLLTIDSCDVKNEHT